jgi:hypothetical protein
MTADLIFDLLRGPHLLGVILGMGTAVYLDLRTLHRITQPYTSHDIAELHRVHVIVSIAFASLWATGLTLMWYRTGFDLNAFSPKLWAKILVVSTLTLNSFGLSTVIFPMLRRLDGGRIIDLPPQILLNMSLAAGVSMACWLLALSLGFSKVLKTSGWDVLVPFLAGGVIMCVGGTVAVMFTIRAFDRLRLDDTGILRPIMIKSQRTTGRD